MFPHVGSHFSKNPGELEIPSASLGFQRIHTSSPKFVRGFFSGEEIWLHASEGIQQKYPQTKKKQVKKKTFLVGGWTNPFEKYARQNGFIFPNFRGEHNKSQVKKTTFSF